MDTPPNLPALLFLAFVFTVAVWLAQNPEVIERWTGGRK
jgi:hypothetical protein